MNNSVNMSLNVIKTNLNSTLDKNNLAKNITDDKVKSDAGLKNKKPDNSFKKVIDSKLNSNKKVPNDNQQNDDIKSKESEENVISDVESKELKDDVVKTAEDTEDKLSISEETINNDEKSIDPNILETLLAYLLGKCDLDKVENAVGSEKFDVENLLVLLNNEDFSGNIQEFLLSVKDKVSGEELNKLLLMMNPEENNEELLKSILQKVNVKDVFTNILKNASSQDKILKTTEESQSSEGLKNFQVPGKETLFSSMETSHGTDNSESSFNKEEKILLSLINDDKSTGKDIPKGLFSMINGLSSRTNLEQLNAAALSNVENPVINAANMPKDIIESIKFMDFNNLKELSIKIVPKELGEVFIKLTVEAGVMKANISAVNKDTYSLLNANISDINQRLNEGNIKVSEVNINIYQDDTTFFSGESQKQYESRGNNKNNSRHGNGNEVVEINENVSETPKEDDNNVNILV